MKYFILLIIRLYWILIPKSKRKKCIFRKSCSNYVFEITQKEGFINGLKAFRFRYNNCRNGFQVFKNPVTNKIQLILPSLVIVEKEEIAERLIENQV
ncbi:membrane protein insertion efficiency factor YidD [Flavobacterium panacagri]|uniref:membrane protein insertion efficiency factor YidD n=1 Tax=Flavobacterium panacagri TaxID=3034146 RepID=UPI0025A5CD76|nr:membrane protein insertion efficiency factor YidD [Flavobacterium panacagri]